MSENSNQWDNFEIESGSSEAKDKALKTWKKYFGNDDFFLKYPKKTIYELMAGNAEAWLCEPAIDFEGRVIRFNEFLKKIDETARALKAAGVGIGDAVTVSMPNIPQALYCFYALSKIGAVPSMIHPLSASGEITQYLTISKSVMLMTVDLFFDKNLAAANDYAEKTGRSIKVVVTSVGDELSGIKRLVYEAANKKKVSQKELPENAVTWKRFIKSGEGTKAPTYGFKNGKKEDETAVILYSGGTTGTPKGILLTDLNVNAEAIQTLTVSGETREPGLKMLSVMPLFHGFGLGIGIHMPLVYGVECVLMPRFSVDGYAKILRTKKPNFIPGVPTLFEALLRTKTLEKTDLSFLRGVFCGGDTLPPDLKDRVDDFLKNHGAKVQIREGYGTTECVTASCLTPKDYNKRGSIGIPFPDTYYMITKTGTTEPAATGEEGEICLRGPSVMLGYANDEAETANALRRHDDGLVWLHTGDLGYMDDEGFLYFRQRLKRLIITSGYNIYPTQVEAVISSHPAVHLCCVIGVKDSYKMERVKAFVMVRPGFEAGDELADDIKRYCRERMIKVAVPKEIEFREDLPRTLVGKVDYRKLEENV
ncbi:MAG: AMP-binding protein [Clostridia bacterium]|nr:AMP-binding protein [Clostridia bacterium]